MYGKQNVPLRSLESSCVLLINHLQSRTKRSNPRDAVSHSATSLRKQKSKLSVSDPRCGAAHKVPSRHPWLQGYSTIHGQRMCAAANAPRSPLAILGYGDTRPSMVVGWRIWRVPRSRRQELTRLVCSAS